MTPLFALLFILFLVVAIIIAVTALFGGMLGPSFNRFNPFLTRTATSPDPCCGQCGYATRGISTFECPECGADLREVGIKTPGQFSDATRIFVIALVYSAVFLIASITMWNLIEARLPSVVKTNARIKLQPASGQYKALVRIDTEETIWGGGPYNNALGFTLGFNEYPPNTPLNTTLTGMTPGMRMTSLSILLDPASPTGGAWHSPELSIDPSTREASWNDLQGNHYQSWGAFTDQDVLAFLVSAGADRTNSDVIHESKQLHLLLDGLAQNKDRFTLVGFSTYGGGGGTGGGGSARGYTGICLLIAIVLWFLGLLLIIYRVQRKPNPQGAE